MMGLGLALSAFCSRIPMSKQVLLEDWSLSQAQNYEIQGEHGKNYMFLPCINNVIM